MITAKGGTGGGAGGTKDVCSGPRSRSLYSSFFLLSMEAGTIKKKKNVPNLRLEEPRTTLNMRPINAGCQAANNLPTPQARNEDTC